MEYDCWQGYTRIVLVLYNRKRCYWESWSEWRTDQSNKESLHQTWQRSWKSFETSEIGESFDGMLEWTNIFFLLFSSEILYQKSNCYSCLKIGIIFWLKSQLGCQNISTPSSPVVTYWQSSVWNPKQSKQKRWSNMNTCFIGSAKAY